MPNSLEAYSTTSSAERRHDRCCAIAALTACRGSTARPGQTCQFAMDLCPTRMRQLLDLRSMRGCQWPSIRPTARGPAFSSCMLQVRRFVLWTALQKIALYLIVLEPAPHQTYKAKEKAW